MKLKLPIKESRRLALPLTSRVSISISKRMALEIEDAARLNKMSFCEFLDWAIFQAFETDMACLKHNARVYMEDSGEAADHKSTD